ncbi:MAG: tRNA (adenosine(37)-N6)-threonylcarbamoyltransferase complex dimerization subunit type 1 TsaB [Acutalibacteraceae bacterium]
MIILAVDCSANPASAALVQDEKIVGDFFINTKITHSQTLMVMIEALLKATNTDINAVDAFAVTAGPGSFTGVRIGVSAVKGMSLALSKPCVSVSTLEAMAYNITNKSCVVCAVMDARCSQVYNALFTVSNGEIKRLCEDRALSIADLTNELKGYSESIILVGDGASICYNAMKAEIKDIELAGEAVRYQRASSVGLCAYKKYQNGETISSEELMPTYLRLPQAERELKKKKQEELK